MREWLNQKKIAQRLGISKARVSQIAKKYAKELKNHKNKNGEYDYEKTKNIFAPKTFQPIAQQATTKSVLLPTDEIYTSEATPIATTQEQEEEPSHARIKWSMIENKDEDTRKLRLHNELQEGNLILAEDVDVAEQNLVGQLLSTLDAIKNDITRICEADKKKEIEAIFASKLKKLIQSLKDSQLGG